MVGAITPLLKKVILMNAKMLAALSSEQESIKLTPIRGKELGEYMGLVEGWRQVGEKHLVKEFNFTDFLSGWRFVSKVADIAEMEGHHPRMCVDYGEVVVILSTHSIDAISKNDFIMAAKIDRIK